MPVNTGGVLHVRRAVPGDAMDVARIHVRSWQSGYRGLLPREYLDVLRPEDRASRYTFDSMNPEGPFTLVAVDGDVVTGLVTVGRSRDDDVPDAGEVWAIYVDPSRWGQGVGQTLMSEGITQLRRSGHTVAALWVLSANARARRFYESGGWERDDSERIDFVGGRSVREVRYRRSIGALADGPPDWGALRCLPCGCPPGWVMLMGLPVSLTRRPRVNRFHGQLLCAAMSAMEQAIWPLMGLEVATPTLALRYITDDLGVELAILAAEGVHDPAVMPFSTPWNDAPSPELERNTMRFYWRNRADTTVEHWNLNLAVVVDSVVVGMCSIEADGFPARRSAETGSWLGRRYQRRGIGREVRHAALHLIFAGFDADQATTRAWHDNAASLGVTGSLPYVQTGTSLQQRRECSDTMLEFTMDRAQWDTVHRNDIDLIGIDAARMQLGTARKVAASPE